MPSSNQRTMPGSTSTTSREAVTTYEVMARLAPKNSGPKVMADQYSKTRCANGRCRSMRQIWPSVRSIVTIKATAVMTTATRPTEPSRLALRENCVR